MTNLSLSEPRCALISVFNHQYERNVPRLEEYYGPRFAVRKYLMPFARSANPDVIGVYANGWSFGHHIAQGADRFIRDDIDYYVFAGDDLILNPRLDQASLPAALGLDAGTGYIKSLCLADALRYGFYWTGHAAFALRFAGFDWRAHLPTVEQAWEKVGRLGIRPSPPRPRSWRDVRWALTKFPGARFLTLVNLLMTAQRSPYPLLVGYSDFVVVPRAAIGEFTRICGVLSATTMQAEIVVPTALALSCDRVRTELPIGEAFMDGTPNMPPLSAKALAARAARPKDWVGIENWGPAIGAFEERYGRDFARLSAEFPANALYVHPIKLSRWQ